MSRRGYPGCKQHLGRICTAALVLLISGASFGAQKSIEWQDGMFCEFETKFDPAKYDEEQLRNTIEVIFGDGFAKDPGLTVALIGPGGSLTSNTAEYQQACEHERERVIKLSVLDLVGIEDYRKWSLEVFDDRCRFNVLRGRAASGDPSALREFTPSVATCLPFIEALEGKTDIQALWRGLVDARCKENGRPDQCKAEHYSAASRPNGEDRIKFDVLGFGWTTCSTRYLKTNALTDRTGKMRAALEKQFRRQFKVKAFPCSD